MKSISCVRDDLAEHQTRISRITVPVTAIDFDDVDHLIVGSDRFRLGDRALRTFARLSDTPATFMAKRDPDVRGFLFRRLYPEHAEAKWGKATMSLVLLDGTLVKGVVDPDLALLEGSEVLEAALSVCPEEIDEGRFEVEDVCFNGDLHVSFTSPQLQTSPRVGDVVQAGLHVGHSDTAEFATRICSYLLRLACENGMVVPVCQHTSIETASRIRRASAGNRALTLQRIEDMAATAWQELPAKMKAVEILARERAHNSADLVRSIGVKLRFPDRLVTELIDALDDDELPRSGTLWDVVGAFSRVGTHSDRLSRQTRLYLQETSGQLIQERVDLCPRCGAVNTGNIKYLPRR